MTDPAGLDAGAARLELELSLHPDDTAQLARLAGASGGAAKPTGLRLVWHDTADTALATSGLSVVERSDGQGAATWLLERMRPPDPADASSTWMPGAPTPCIATSASAAALPDIPPQLLPVAGFTGEQRGFTSASGVRLGVLSGALTSVAAASQVCRVILDGEAAAVSALALDLAGALRLSVPAVSLAAQAYAIGRPAPAPRRLGPPLLQPGLSVDDAFAHVTAHLLDVILHHAGRAVAGDRPEPVHQMRVAMRRMRSAFGLFAGVTSCPEIDAAKAELRAFGALLGPARDWDVFLAGTCADILAMFPADQGIARMAAKAARRREAAYVALLSYLGAAEFRRLGLSLALLALRQPWRETAPREDSEPADAAQADLAAFAAKALSRRLKRLVAPGPDISGLPVDELHAIRLNGKRLRYAAEFFAPVFPGREARRFLRRMTALQERLGHLNDGNVAAGLMAEIGQARGYAGGIVTGFVAAGGKDARDRIGRSWKRFRKLDPFWK